MFIYYTRVIKENDILIHKKNGTEWLVMYCKDLNNIELMAINVSKKVKQYTIFINEDELNSEYEKKC